MSMPACVLTQLDWLQAVEADCATLGALLKTMLGLLSKPHAAADLFSCELHAQAGTSPTAVPVEALQPSHPGQNFDSNSPHLQGACSLRAFESGGAEAVKPDSLPPDAGAQPGLVDTQTGTSQGVNPVVPWCAAAKDAEAPKYEDGVRHSSAEAADAAAGVSSARSGSRIGPVLAQFPDADSQEPADGASEGQVRPVKGQPDPGERQAVSAGTPGGTTTEQAPTQLRDAPHTTEQAAAQLHNAPHATSMAGSLQQPHVPSQTAGKACQQGTTASRQLVAAGTGAGSGTAAAGAGLGAGTGVGPGQAAAGTGAGAHADARAGSTAGRGGKHKGGGRGAKGHEVGMCLTGSAAQALAVLQAGPSSRPAPAEDTAGAHMPLLLQTGNDNTTSLMVLASFPWG